MSEIPDIRPNGDELEDAANAIRAVVEWGNKGTDGAGHHCAVAAFDAFARCPSGTLLELREERDRLAAATRGLLRAINDYDPGWPHPESDIWQAMHEVRSVMALDDAAALAPREDERA